MITFDQRVYAFHSLFCEVLECRRGCLITFLKLAVN